MKNLSRKEAAKVLEDMKVKIEIPKAAVMQNKRNAALDMAIEALKYSEIPNSSTDCISRQAATSIPIIPKEHRKIFKSIDDAFETGWNEALSCANMLPSAQPEPHWIPCSERLPEEDTEVLISYRYKEGEGDTDHVNIDITSYGTTCFGGREIHTLKEWRQPFDYFHANYEVIAWMPLPEPYKGGDSE